MIPVKRPIISVSKAVEMNKAVWFSPWGSGVCDAKDFHIKPPSQHLPLRAQGGVYRLPVHRDEAGGATNDSEQLAAIEEDSKPEQEETAETPLMSSGFKRSLVAEQRRDDREARCLEQMVEGEFADHAGRTPWAPTTPSDQERRFGDC